MIGAAETRQQFRRIPRCRRVFYSRTDGPILPQDGAKINIFKEKHRICHYGGFRWYNEMSYDQEEIIK